MPRAAPLQLTPLGDTDPFTPTPQRPVRVRARSMPVDTHFQPHRHAWAQLAYCAVGIVQVTVATPGEVTTYIVPPSRGVWIAPGARHSITVLEAAEFRTLYMDASATPAGWDGCRVIVISALVRELIQALDAPDGQPGRGRGDPEDEGADGVHPAPTRFAGADQQRRLDGDRAEGRIPAQQADTSHWSAFMDRSTWNSTPTGTPCGTGSLDSLRLTPPPLSRWRHR